MQFSPDSRVSDVAVMVGFPEDAQYFSMVFRRETGVTPSQYCGLDSDAVIITMTWWGGQTRHDQTQAVCDLYTSQHPNVQFELLPSGWDGYFDRLATQTASGSMSDIVQLDYQYLTTYARNGSLTDLQPFIDNGTIDVSNIDAELLQTGKAADFIL